MRFFLPKLCSMFEDNVIELRLGIERLLQQLPSRLERLSVPLQQQLPVKIAIH